MNRICFLFLFFFLHLFAKGQDYSSLYFERIDHLSQGLISDVVNTTNQDANGFLWFGTDEGLVRYDGYEFRSFKNEPNLGVLYGVQINKIVTDDQGRIFICTNQGFYAFSRSFEPILQFAAKSFYQQEIWDCLLAKNGKIYISSNESLFEVDEDAKTVSILKKENGRTNIIPKQIVEDPKGRIWVGSWNSGLFLLLPDNKTLTSFKIFKKASQLGEDDSAYSLYIDSQGYLWVGTWGCGLYVLDVSSGTNINVIKTFRHQSGNLNSIPGDIIHTVTEDANNTIWIGTPYGLSSIRYPLTEKHQVTRYKKQDQDGLSSNVIKDIYRDRTGLLWIGTKGGGVIKLNLDQKKFVTKQIPELDPQIRTQAVHAFEIDHKGRLLIGVLSLGFVVYDMEKERFFSYKNIPEYSKIGDGFDLNTINCFLWDQDSALWMGTRYNGLIRFNPKDGSCDYVNNATTNRAFKGREVNVIYLEKNGDIYAGTELGLNQISHYGNRQFKVRHINFSEYVPDLTGRMGVTGVLLSGNQKLLVATESAGLFEVEQVQGEIKVSSWGKNPDQLKITTLFKDSDNRIWVGTKGKGVFFLDENSREFLLPNNSEQLIVGDVICGMNQDSYGNIWMTTNHGLAKFSMNTPSSVDWYFYRDGLQGNIFIYRSFFKDRAGRFYIGGHNGFNVFDPLQITKGYDPFHVVITDVHIDGERYPYFPGVTEEVEIDYTQNDFNIVFASLSFLFPEANQYAYRVDGIDKNWKYVDAQMRSANYSNLEPGTYTLRVRGSNSQGTWSETEAILDILVRPNPYLSWWAYSVYFFISAIVLGFVIYFRINALRIKQRLHLEKIEHLKAEKLNQYKLRFFTNISHELLTPLSILYSAVEVMNLKKQYMPETLSVMERTINKLNRLIRSLLLFRKLETGNMGLKLAEEDLSVFARKVVQDFNLLSIKKNICFDIRIETDVKGTTDPEKLEMILHNLLSNAFRYTPEGGTVSFILQKSADSFEFEITDTGIGIPKENIPYIFDRFFRVSDGETGSGGIGIGLNLTKSLVDMLEGQIAVESEKGKGTCFLIRLPLNPKNPGVVKTVSEELNEVESGDVFVESDENNSVDADLWGDREQRKKATILVAEDNEDFRKMLREALQEYFVVLEANNGVEALEIAREKDIDLIISDVRMPLLSGRELCLQIKSDLQYSHIPVILVTAKIGEEQKLAGYEAGADAYIEKPVQIKLLMARIHVLLNQRRALMRKFKSEQIFEPENVTITPLDENFIIEAKSIIEKNIGDPDFSVKILADELNASNSMLYRKMRTLIGVSPSEFIRNIRLRRAAQLLENKAFSVSEVAYNCGFNDLSYFGSCFKKMYGVTPTAYQTGDRSAPER